MQNLIKLLSVLILSAVVAPAQVPLARQLKSLDRSNSCRSPRQMALAERSLAWVDAYAQADMRTQLGIFSADFLLYHVTLSFLAANAGTAASQLPFDAGPLTKKNYVQSIAFLGWANDLYQVKEIPTSVTCLDENTTTMNLSFKGAQVKRDAQGYITHEVPYAGVATKLFAFDKAGRMTRQYVDTDPLFSVEIRKKLAELSSGPPNVQKNERTRHTYAELLKRYQDQIVGRVR